jgi:hypothetical protein
LRKIRDTILSYSNVVRSFRPQNIIRDTVRERSMLWQHLSSLFSHFGFIAVIVGVMVCRASPAARASFVKLGALLAILTGIGVSIAAVMTITQDHLLTAIRWGHHGIRELILAIGCSVLGVLQVGLGFALLRYQGTDPNRGHHSS